MIPVSNATPLWRVTRLPYGQLDLTTDPNQNPNQFFRAYRDLLFNKQGQILDGGTLRDLQIDVPDGMGGFIQVTDPTALIGARMSFRWSPARVLLFRK